MALLRASSKALGDAADEMVAVGRGDDDGGVAGGAALIAYAEAVHAREGVDVATAALVAELGRDAAGDAALTVAAFNGLVRVADGIGIQLDDGTESETRAARPGLGIDDFGGASNTRASGSVSVPDGDVVAMFSSSD